MASRRSPRDLLLAAAMLRLALPVVVAADIEDEVPTPLPEFFVPGNRVASPEIAVPRGELQPPTPNFGPELLAIPGVYGHARAAEAMEPTIRGLGFDRVATTLNGLPLVNASPERTNSPVVILGASAVTGMTVMKALPSVTLGPATTGGRIALTTDGTTAEPPSDPFRATLSTFYNGARDGTTTTARVSGRSGAWEAAGTWFRNDLGDYRAADGRRVAARFQDTGGSASLGWHTRTQSARFDVLTRRLERQDAVSLPLDGRNTESQVLTFTHRWTPLVKARLEAVEWRIGNATTDPYITSEDRASPPISAHSTARSFGAGVTTDWRASADDTLHLGADLGRQYRRAVRTTPAGKDFIWPGAHYEDAGLFAEWRHASGKTWSARTGVRLDDVRSDADDAKQLALGKPIYQQYITYNGAGAAHIARHESAGAANVLFERNVSSTSSVSLGFGYTVQPATVMERYRAFLNALGGDGHGGNAVELGNPALRPEKKSAIEAGGILRTANIEFEAAAYYYRVADFNLRVPIGVTQPPLAPMTVFGYRNVNAEFTGAELVARLSPAVNWSVPLSVAIAAGRNLTGGTQLAEIPPAEATAAVRYHRTVRNGGVAAEVGARYVTAKDNPAPLENPLYGHAGGFALWHLRAGFTPAAHLRIEAGIENLLNHPYTEYLVPPVAPVRPASGDLLPGDRVPGPGRSAWVSVTLGW